MYYDYVSWNIQTTNDCFLKCDYCMTATSNLLKKKAQTTAVSKVLQLSKGMRRVNIVFIGGEPLMVGKDWFNEAYASMKAAPMETTSRVYTNGHLLDTEWVEMFRREKTQIVVSFDGLGNGAKGAQRGLDKIQEFAKDISAVSMTVSMSNYKGLIDCYKQVSAAGVKRFTVQFDIYADKDEAVLLGKETCKLFDYIEANPNGAKCSIYTDIKAMLSGKTQRFSVEFEPTVINNDYCVNADGTITLGVPDCFDPEWQLGNIYENDVSHVNDLLYHPTLRQVNRDFIESLNLIGELSKVNDVTRGGGFFFDKKGIMPMNRPNFPKLYLYRELFNHFGGL
ncbi:radical SAM protein [Vibrio fortis]|uniref:Radical SAM protein n=1 Tax=Vibrio fortis TaxID=212667 RepID=A0A5N3QTF4_9VIBR|nr:radical SAM protein [Vibrio fortis]KAB0285477.1 radical SAM protein [Vibrio fortis]